MSTFTGQSDGRQAFTFHMDTSDCILFDSLPDSTKVDAFVTSGVPHPL